MNTSSTSNHHKSRQKLGLNMAQHIQSISGSSTATADAFLGSSSKGCKSTKQLFQSVLSNFQSLNARSTLKHHNEHRWSREVSTKALGYLGRWGPWAHLQLQAQPACCECGPLVTQNGLVQGVTTIHELSGAWCFYCEAVEPLKIFDFVNRARTVGVRGN